MDKLSPRPEKRSANYTWKDLDIYLQGTFSSIRDNNVAIIYPENYAIPYDELLSELKSAGYSVTESGSILEIR
ncbi:hypothetical protein [Streptococcus porcorum]|uniref:Uncharacterized protein n=1 Tax=Streptococcus porcorum TaxID=701526 RepID=A0ABV2JFC0_9STRE